MHTHTNTHAHTQPTTYHKAVIVHVQNQVLALQYTHTHTHTHTHKQEVSIAYVMMSIQTRQTSPASTPFEESHQHPSESHAHHDVRTQVSQPRLELSHPSLIPPRYTPHTASNRSRKQLRTMTASPTRAISALDSTKHKGRQFEAVYTW